MLELLFLDRLHCNRFEGLIQLAWPRHVLLQEVTPAIQSLFLCSTPDGEPGQVAAGHLQCRSCSWWEDSRPLIDAMS